LSFVGYPDGIRTVLLKNEQFLHYPEVMKHFDSNRPEFAPYGFTCEVWEPRSMSRPDQHNEIEVNFLEQGRLTYLFGGKRITLDANELTLFWAAVPHQIIEFENVERYFVATIPFGWFMRWGLPEELRSHLVLGNVVSNHSQPEGASHDRMRFQQWQRDLDGSGDDLREAVELELRARVLRFSTSYRCVSTHVVPVSTGEGRSNPTGLEKAELMAGFIAKNFRSRLLIKEIAANVNLHPDYAAALFRKTFGITLNLHITQHRVAEAQRLLLTSDRRIVDIALLSGFDSLSRFNRAFKQLTGSTPSRFRINAHMESPKNLF